MYFEVHWAVHQGLCCIWSGVGGYSPHIDISNVGGHFAYGLLLEIYVENIVEKGRNCSRGAISPLIHNISLPDIKFLC